MAEAERTDRGKIMPSLTIISVGAGKDGKEKVEAVTIEPTATLRAARKFAAKYCKDSPPPRFDSRDAEAALDGAARRIVEAKITDTDLRLAEAGNREAKLRIEEAIWPVKRKPE